MTPLVKAAGETCRIYYRVVQLLIMSGSAAMLLIMCLRMPVLTVYGNTLPHREV